VSYAHPRFLMSKKR